MKNGLCMLILVQKKRVALGLELQYITSGIIFIVETNEAEYNPE